MQGWRPTASPQGAAPVGRSIVCEHSRLQHGARKGVDCRTPARGYRPRPTLPPARAMTSTAGMAAPWQGSYRWARAVAACVIAGPTMPWRRSHRMVIWRFDGTNDDEIYNHRAWRCVDAHIDPIMSD
ncbi:hypothetical protein BHE74_00030284 [Ensete ventricosum]|nr:hypothetical protein BHE74_00030284 [Ensete ventricosum]